MNPWGSVQYSTAYETFQTLLSMDRKEALDQLNIKELPKVSPDTLVEYVSYDSDTDKETDKKVPIKQFFDATKDEAWDLWEAASAACIVFGELFNISTLRHDITGQECFLLWISGAFKGEEDPDEIFGGFCT